MPRFTPIVAKLPSTVPFVGPETQERSMGRKFDARLGANESVFGPSPKALEAMRNATGDTWQYADPENFDLKQALAEHHGVEPSNIVVGEGIDGLLGLLARMLVGEGDHVVTSLGAYPTFNFHVTGFGGNLVTVPYKCDHEDPDAIAEAMTTHNAKLGYFANPDNPMGSWHGKKTIQALIDRVPEDSVLCLDEAYVEFAPKEEVVPLDVSNSRVIRMRTFSKAHGMAGSRVGYGIGHSELIDAFNKVRNHFGVNRIAQAGALAALHDKEWLSHVVGEVEKARDRISEIAQANGLTPLPSATNFVTIDCGKDADFAQALVVALGEQGVFVRMPFVEPQNRCIRISAGRSEDLDILKERLPKALASIAP